MNIYFLNCEGLKTMNNKYNVINSNRGGSATAATSKIEHFVIIVNGFQPIDKP